MSDLISRQAAIDELDMLCQEHRYKVPGKVETYSQYNEAWQDALDRAEGAIGNLPSAQQWIPVTERLPEFDELVLAWVENKDPNGGFNEPGIYTAQLKDKVPKHDPKGKKNIWGIPGYDSEWTVWAWSYFSEPDVKAWMPLPEPYVVWSTRDTPRKETTIITNDGTTNMVGNDGSIAGGRSEE